MTDELIKEEKALIKEANRDMKKLVKFAPIIIVAAVFLFLGYIVASVGQPQSDVNNLINSISGDVVQPYAILPSKEKIKTDMMDFVQNSLLSDGATASLVSMEEANGMYKLNLNLNFNGQAQNASLFVTKDGQMYTIQLSNVSEVKAQVAASKGTTTPPAATTTPKNDKPVVEAFVMSHCPYGTQIEKGLLPVASLLGSSIDFKIKFVSYAMHGKTEVDEQLLQYCIMTEQPTKYNAYLSCFLGAGDTATCLTQVGITSASLASCKTTTDAKYNITGMFNDKSTWISGTYPQFNIHKEDNVKYGVQGSPALIINGVQVNSARDPASLLKAVCAAFNNAPSACSTALNSTAPSAGFGYTGTPAASTGSCG